MKIDTYLFGAVEVDPEKVITFPNGLVAFENDKRFTLVHEEGKTSPVSFTLQSLDDPLLAFQVIDAAALGFNYELALTDAESTALGSPANDDIVVMQVLFKEGSAEAGVTPNLRAPLLINTKAKLGLQKVMETFRPNITLSNLASAV